MTEECGQQRQLRLDVRVLPIPAEQGAQHERVADGPAGKAPSAKPRVIAKSIRPDRMAQNLDVFDFELSDKEMARIAALDTGTTVFFDHRDPQMVAWLGGRRVD
jgi:2,5-diketo-D-gluconate reductase A